MTRLQLDRSGPWIAVGGLCVVLWYAISTSLYAPWWAVVLFVAAIVPQAVLVRRWAAERPRLCMVVPLVGMVVIALTSWAGATWWGWSA